MGVHGSFLKSLELSDDRLTVVYEKPLGSTTTALSATEVPHKIGSLEEEMKKIIDRPRTPYRKSIVWIFGVLLGKEIVCWQCSPSTCFWWLFTLLVLSGHSSLSGLL